MAKKVDVKDLDSTSSDSEDEGHLNLEFRYFNNSLTLKIDTFF